MPEHEYGSDPWFSNRGPSWKHYFELSLKFIKEKWINHREKYKIPSYAPTNPDWNLAFRALGLDYPSVKRFWKVFCKANKSLDGQICLEEFLEFFNLERTGYVEKTFQYFDTTGGGEIDFLEFVVSVWNVCALDPHTLTNFTFDMYDVDSDGLLSCPEIETMIRELFGDQGAQNNSLAQECMDELMKLTEENGAITLQLFTIFSLRHSILLFPIYQIQRKLQSKVLGLKFWHSLHKKVKNLSRKTKRRSRSWMKRNVSVEDRNMIIYEPRHILVLLRSYKCEREFKNDLEEDAQQCKNLREWVRNNSKQWTDDDWDKEIPSLWNVLSQKIYKFFILPTWNLASLAVHRKKVKVFSEVKSQVNLKFIRYVFAEPNLLNIDV